MLSKRFIPVLLLLQMLTPAAALAGVVKIGVYSPDGFEAGMRRWQPTADYLTSRIQDELFMVLPYRQLADLEQDARHGKFDFVLTHPVSFVELEKHTGLQRLLTQRDAVENQDHSHLATVFFTRADNDSIYQIKDLQDKTFVSTSQDDFSGWQVARLELRHYQLEADDAFRALVFAGDAQGVLRGVMEGEFEAGAMSAADFAAFLRSGVITEQAVRVLNRQQDDRYPYPYSSALYPHWPLGVAADTDLQLKNAVKHALLNMPGKHQALRTGDYAGWTEPLNYWPVRQLLDQNLTRQLVEQQLAVAGVWVEQQRWLLITLAGSLLFWLLVRVFGSRRPQTL